MNSWQFSFRFILVLGAFVVIGLGCSQKQTQGKSGSLARMNIVGDYLYTVNLNKINIHDISNPLNPKAKSTVHVKAGRGNRIETLWPLGDKLFLGSTQGMFIYSIKNPAKPKRISSYAHFTACDPVVPYKGFAYVTLRSGSGCRRSPNELHILNIKNIFKPKQIATFPMMSPRGLAVEDDVLFVADGPSGLKVYDVKNPYDLTQLGQVDDFGAHDLILDKPYLFLMAKRNIGIYQYGDLQKEMPKQVSLIEIKKTTSTKLQDWWEGLDSITLTINVYIFLLILTAVGGMYNSIKENGRPAAALSFIGLLMLLVVGAGILVIFIIVEKLNLEGVGIGLLFLIPIGLFGYLLYLAMKNIIDDNAIYRQAKAKREDPDRG